MPKIPQCDRCSFYAHNPNLICAVNPNGVEGDPRSGSLRDRCLDFRPDPNFQEEEKWAPEGYSWYDGELIPNRPSRYTAEEKLFIP